MNESNLSQYDKLKILSQVLGLSVEGSWTWVENIGTMCVMLSPYIAYSTTLTCRCTQRILSYIYVNYVWVHCVHNAYICMYIQLSLSTWGGHPPFLFILKGLNIPIKVSVNVFLFPISHQTNMNISPKLTDTTNLIAYNASLIIMKCFSLQDCLPLTIYRNLREVEVAILHDQYIADI